MKIEKKSKTTYTDKELVEIEREYTARRNNGELNTDILESLEKNYEKDASSIMMRLVKMLNVYKKNTEEEKVTLKERKGIAKKANKKSKEDLAVNIAEMLEGDHALATDAMKLTVKSLNFLETQIAGLLAIIKALEEELGNSILEEMDAAEEDSAEDLAAEAKLNEEIAEEENEAMDAMVAKEAA